MYASDAFWRAMHGMARGGKYALGASAIALVASICLAANILAARYDPETDEIVAQVAYRGTNPDHEFSLRWGECKPLQNASVPNQIGAQIIDSQWDDRARQDFKKEVRFSLTSVSCRPARVSLHSAPGFVQTLDVPAAPASR